MTVAPSAAGGSKRRERLEVRPDLVRPRRRQAASCLALLLAAVILSSCSPRAPVASDSTAGPQQPSRDLFIMYSANAPREAPATFARFFTPGDYARVESLPDNTAVARRFRYVLPTSLRVEWKGEPGVRFWTRRGCGDDTPGTIVYDPEFRPDWTPVQEVEDLVASVRRAARLVDRTGCHRFGIAPGAEPFFGLDAESCQVHLDRGVYPRLPWRSIDLVDIQAQRLLSQQCLQTQGLSHYRSAVSAIAEFATEANPDTEVVSQVSFRDNDPSAMKEAIARVADVVDGVYFSYPSTEPSIPCTYCTVADLQVLLRYLRG